MKRVKEEDDEENRIFSFGDGLVLLPFLLVAGISSFRGSDDWLSGSNVIGNGRALSIHHQKPGKN